MKLTHKQKIKKAKKMLSKSEIKDGIDVFQSKQWDKQKEGRHSKMLKKMGVK